MHNVRTVYIQFFRQRDSKIGLATSRLARLGFLKPEYLKLSKTTKFTKLNFCCRISKTVAKLRSYRLRNNEHCLQQYSKKAQQELTIEILDEKQSYLASSAQIGNKKRRNWVIKHASVFSNAKKSLKFTKVRCRTCPSNTRNKVYEFLQEKQQ